MLDASIKVIRHWDTQGFSPGGGTLKQYHYMFTIGPHGPFTETFGAGNHTPDEVAKRLNARVLHMRESGVLNTPGE